MSAMGLLYKREKRAIFKVVVLTIVALSILGASIRYWYIAVPVIAVIAGLLVWARRCLRPFVSDSPRRPHPGGACTTNHPEGSALCPRSSS